MPFTPGLADEKLVYKVSRKESLYQGFFQLNRYHLTHKLFQGGWSDVYRREIFERGHAAAVLLLDLEREQLVLVEQFRPGAMETEEHPWLIELVAGIIEPGEKPDQVVRREAGEEASCRVLRLEKICEYLVSPGGSSERIWLYLGEVDAANVAQYAGLEDENEDIKIHCVSVGRAFDWLKKGRINNAMSLIALQWLKLNWQDRADFWQ